MQLGESWIVEGDDEIEQEHTAHEEDQKVTEPVLLPRASRQKPKRTTISPEPELIMPFLDSSTLEGSWADASSRSPRAPKASRVAERHQEARRRSSRQAANTNVSEKRVEPRITSKKYQQQQGTGPEILDLVTNQLGIMLFWMMDVLGRALKILKTPISFVLAVWLLLGLGIILRNLVTTSIYTSLSPLCRIPGASMMNIPFCPPNGGLTSENFAPPVEFDQLMTVQSKFEEVLEESAGGVSLPMDMKRGEASIRDLRQLVKYSQLHSK